MPYFLLAQIAIVAVVLAEIFIFKTGLFSDIRFWLAYGIVVFFQLLTNGYLTFNEIVTYNPDAIGGTRLAYAPVEDLFFGFALVTLTLLVWSKIKPSKGNSQRPAELINSMSKLEPGTQAPQFKALDSEENELSSDSFTGQKTILYFYPAAGTPGCTNQACDFRDNLNSLKALGFTVIGVSPDKPAKLAKFKEKESLNFTLLSDPENEIQKLYGAYGLKKMYGKEYEGTIRSTFVIGADGKIEHAFYNVKAKGHVEMLRKQLGF